MNNLVKDANFYIEGATFLGKGSVTLPEVTTLTETFESMGIAGDVDIPLPGLTEALEGSIKMSSWDADGYAIMLDTSKAHQLDVRFSMQRYDSQTGATEEVPCQAVIRASFKSMSGVELKRATTEGAEFEFTAPYYKLRIGDEDVLEIDKFNYIYRVKGRDLLEQTRLNLGM
jgi:uncharacterized protein